MLTLERISAGYGDATVLRDVSLAVPTGRVVALLGPNGAGKTTLLRVASGLLRPASGEVRMDGRSLTGRPADVYAGAGVCLIPEGRGIFPSMTVKDNLLLQTGPRQDQNALELATEAFPRLGQRLNQIAGTLSGGEQQMLAVTRAYLSDPAVVMLDEVSLGLAPIIVDEIFSFLAGLAARGTALLIVEQYVARALAIADFVFLLNQGDVVFAGETREIDEAAVFSAYVGADVA